MANTFKFCKNLSCSHCGSHNVTTSTRPVSTGIIGVFLDAVSKLTSPSANLMPRGTLYIHCRNCGKTSMINVM